MNEERGAQEKGEAAAPPARVETGDGPVTVFGPGFPLHWRLRA